MSSTLYMHATVVISWALMKWTFQARLENITLVASQACLTMSIKGKDQEKYFHSCACLL